MERELSHAERAMYLGPFAEPSTRVPTHVFPAQLWGADTFLEEVYDGLPGFSSRPVLIVWGLKDFAFREPERKCFQFYSPLIARYY